ncbi:hypothetical protein [Kitasatospora paracochleata]|uniref:Syndecan 1 n=1 Tax=Kitasatospora paracochleata TaxID=58354 RepID=A0ABT1IVJ7_9ACTN|nr:hypothetical protein [Kitasatospora paracochleata]MCP2309150.1 hypothetical protein [Kitasatospora paracochleata]
MPLRPAVRTGGPERGTAVPVQRQGPELTLASSADLPVRALAAVPLVPGGSVPPAGGPDAGVRPSTVEELDSPQVGPRTAPETFSLPQPSAGTLPLLGDRAPLGEQPVEPLSPAPEPPRRLGLGAPLPAPPPSVQRSASPSARVRGRIGEPLREVPTAPPYEDTAPATEPPAGRPVPLREGPTTTAPPYEDSVSTAVRPVVPNALAPRTGDAVPAPAPVQRTAAGSELPVVRPVPLPPGPGVRGAVDPAVGAADGGVRADGAVLVGERGLELRSAPMPVQRDAAESAASEPVVVPVRPLASDRPRTVRVRPVPAPDAHSAPAALPVQRAAAGDPGAVAVAAGIGQRMPDGSVVFAPPAAPATHPTATHPTAPVPSATVQRSEDANLAGPTDPPPPPPAPDPPPAPAPPPVGDAAAAAAATAPAPPSGGAESTDELVRRLIDPLSRLLRAELRLDRERAGLRLDNRY